jgi:TfoX/Sxy family transcriptional regulator of competence genes
MAWVKIPKEHHPLFHAALPKHPGVSTLNMFGGVAAKANGQMFGGLFGRSAIVKLSPDEQSAALALDGATLFDPMGNGRVMRDTVQLPESVMDEPEELRAWLRKAFDYTMTLPRKLAKKPAARPGTKPSVKPVAKPPSKRSATPRAKASSRPAKRR